MDYYGAEWGSLICSCFILLGGTIAAIGASTSSYRTLVAGEVVLGIGSSELAYIVHSEREAQDG